MKPKPITVQLDPSMVELLLKVCRGERAEFAAERSALDEKIAEKDSFIQYLETAFSQPDSEGNARNGDSDAQMPVPVSPTGRLRRGAAQGLVRMFLQTRNGAGATINEICQATKAKYGTTHRLVKLFESKDMAVQSPDGRWHWKAKVEHQETLV